MHILIPWPALRWVALLLGVWGVLWMLGMLAAHRVHPHLLTADVLRLRYLRRRCIDILLAALESVTVGIRSADAARSIAESGTVVLAIADSTNVHLRLDPSREVITSEGPRRLSRVSFWADDPAAAAALIRAALPA